MVCSQAGSDCHLSFSLYSSLAMLTYPYAAHHFFASSSQAAGTFLGLSIHDTSQVIGAAGAYSQMYEDEGVMAAASVTKLSRNICLAGALPVLTAKTISSDDSNSSVFSLENFKKHTPTFVYLFVGSSVARTLGDMAFQDQAVWSDLVNVLGNQAPHILLTVAMGGVGLSINLKSLAKHGAKPYVVAFLAASLISGFGFISAYLIHKYLL